MRKSRGIVERLTEAADPVRELANLFMRHLDQRPEEDRGRSMMDRRVSDIEVVRDIWVMHSTDFKLAQRIATTGFTKGSPQTADLSFTHGDRFRSPGINFAYWTDDESALEDVAINADDQTALVVFKTSGVKMWHSDGFWQIAFWGQMAHGPYYVLKGAEDDQIGFAWVLDNVNGRKLKEPPHGHLGDMLTQIESGQFRSITESLPHGMRGSISERLVNDPAEETALNVARSMRMSPRAINNSWCMAFASKLKKALGDDAQMVSTTHMDGVFPGHWIVEYRGRYYDAESPEGVTDPKELAYSKRLYGEIALNEAVDPELIQAAITHYGVTTNPLECGYLLPQGEMLDLSGRHQSLNDYRREGDRWVSKRGPDYMSGARYTDHSDLGEEFDVEDKWEFMSKSGAIRVMPGQGFSLVGAPTARQMAMMCRMAEFYGDRVYVDVLLEDEHHQKEFTNLTPRDLVKFLTSIGLLKRDQL